MTVHSSGKQPWNSVEGRTHRWPPGHHACWSHPPGLSLAGGPAFPSRVQCIWWCGLPGWATKSLAAPSKLLDVLPGEAGEHVTTQLPRDCCSLRKPQASQGADAAWEGCQATPCCSSHPAEAQGNRRHLQCDPNQEQPAECNSPTGPREKIRLFLPATEFWRGFLCSDT